MSIGISNIAWESDFDASVAIALRKAKISAIDLALGKYSVDVGSMKESDAADVRSRWAAEGMSIVGLQGLLFGRPDLQLFDSPSSRKELNRYLQHLARLSNTLGGRCLTFGSPVNRIRGRLSSPEAFKVASEFFFELGKPLSELGQVLCLEPCPAIYKCDFLNTHEEVNELVRYVGHDAIRLQFDTGAMMANSEDPSIVLRSVAKQIGHIHLSEPWLVPINLDPDKHAPLAEAFRQTVGSAHYVIEMTKLEVRDDMKILDNILNFVNFYYESPRK